MNVNEWVCVPRAPQWSMCNAGRDAAKLPLIATARECISAALAAAPSPAPVPVDPAELEALRKLLDKAQQLAGIASDWNLDEVEIDDEMVSVYDLRAEFRAALAANGEKGT